MFFRRSGAGLIPEFPSPVESKGTVDVVTEEAAVQSPAGHSLAVTLLVAEGETVARGAAVACLRHAPDICLVAPIAGRVARISLLPGRKLSEIVLFREQSGGVERHETSASATAGGLRGLMQASGFWPRLRRRPFGGMPKRDEVPVAIFVMGADTCPLAPNPQQDLVGREESFARGLAAMGQLTGGPIFVCWPEAAASPNFAAMDADIRWISCGHRHPQGSAGIRIHQSCPAGLDAPIWDIRAGDVADLGDLLEAGELPMMRHLRIVGAGLREGVSVRSHPGADLRQLTQRIAAPGPHVLISGSHLDGRQTRWLGQRDRQITVLPRKAAPPRPHWLIAALTDSAKMRPAIPTSALNHSLGAVVHAAPFIRALGAGDDETAMSLGLLSLLEEDIALTDYTLSAEGRIMEQLRSMLERIRTEYAA